MKKPVFLMDVGGTHSRIRIIAQTDDMVARPEIIAAANSRIRDKDDLFRFMTGMISDNGLKDRLEAAVVCFAGVVSGQSVAITNWTGTGNLHQSELIKAGLPAKRTILANDMDAASYCLIAGITGEVDLDLKPLYNGASQDLRKYYNSVLIIPGTGVGVAGLLEEPYVSQKDSIVPVSCEVQHTPIPQLDTVHGRILALMQSRNPGVKPSWEDFISGKGLENIYRCMLLEQERTSDMQELSAGDIAVRAVEGMDADCTSALDLYYRCAGALAQVIALTFKAFGGIYLAGDSTRKNMSFISTSGFLEQLQANDVRNDLLRLFPVYLIAGDLNLEGAAYMARRYLYANGGEGVQV